MWSISSLSPEKTHVRLSTTRHWRFVNSSTCMNSVSGDYSCKDVLLALVLELNMCRISHMVAVDVYISHTLATWVLFEMSGSAIRPLWNNHIYVLCNADVLVHWFILTLYACSMYGALQRWKCNEVVSMEGGSTYCETAYQTAVGRGCFWKCGTCRTSVGSNQCEIGAHLMVSFLICLSYTDNFTVF